MIKEDGSNRVRYMGNPGSESIYKGGFVYENYLACSAIGKYLMGRVVNNGEIILPVRRAC